MDWNDVTSLYLTNDEAANTLSEALQAIEENNQVGLMRIYQNAVLKRKAFEAIEAEHAAEQMEQCQ